MKHRSLGSFSYGHVAVGAKVEYIFKAVAVAGASVGGAKTADCLQQDSGVKTCRSGLVIRNKDNTENIISQF